MFLLPDNWNFGYEQILTDCRNHGKVTGGTMGSTLLLCNLDVDAMCAARILSFMLRSDGIPYQLLPCCTFPSLERICHEQLRFSNDVCAIVLFNLGATRNLTTLLDQYHQHDTTKIYVMDCRRPFHLANVYAGENVVVFWDIQQLEDIPSDGDNLSGNDDTSSSGSSSSNDDDDSDDDNDGQSSDGSQEQEFMDHDHDVPSDSLHNDDNDNAHNHFVDNTQGNNPDHYPVPMDTGHDFHDEYDGEDEREEDHQTKRRNKPHIRDNGDNDDDHNHHHNHDHHDLSEQQQEEEQNDDDDDEEVEDEDDDDTHSSSRSNKPLPMEPSEGVGIGTPTTVKTTGSRSTTGSPPSPSSKTMTVATDAADILTPRELHRQRREKLRFYYADGTFHGSPAAYVAYRLSRQFRFGEQADLLWLACVGLTDAYLHCRLDVSGYTALALEFKQYCLQLFPNDMFHRRIGNAVYAEQFMGGTGGGSSGRFTSSSSSGTNHNNNNNNTLSDFDDDTNNINPMTSNRHLTRITFSENGKILAENDYRFFLLRHSSLYDSMVYSDYISTKFQLWTNRGIHKLQELLAKMGYPLHECHQPFAFMKPSLRRRLHDQILLHAEEYGLDNFEFTSFFRITGYQSLLSASDTSYAVTALLECDTPSSSSTSMITTTTTTTTSTQKNSQQGRDDDHHPRSSSLMDIDEKNDDDYHQNRREEEEVQVEEEEEETKVIQAFNIAYDALNCNSTPTVSWNGLSTAEGSSICNLVNGGNLSGNTTTGIGAGIRLAMTLQRSIITTAVHLMERNAITRLRHFRYAYITCTSQGGEHQYYHEQNQNDDVVVRNNHYHNNNNNHNKNSNHHHHQQQQQDDTTPATAAAASSSPHHVFAKPLALTRLAQYLMDIHRENGKWVGDKARPLILMAENPQRNCFLVLGCEYPEYAGHFVKNRFGKHFEVTANTMKGQFQFDRFDSHVVEIHSKDVQRFIEQLHYLMDSI